MIFTILGSGTAAPRLNRNMSGYLLEIEKKKILFDSGPGTIRQLLKLKTSLSDIDHIFYTHLHNDHINDLPAILWSNNYGVYRKKPINLYGPKGFKKYFSISTGMNSCNISIAFFLPFSSRHVPNGTVPKYHTLMWP